MKKKKLVKIFPKEYWSEDIDGELETYYVNGQNFHSCLDSYIETCQMQKYFGTVQLIEIHDNTPNSWDERDSFFVIHNQLKDSKQGRSSRGNPNPIFEWDMCAIQEELTIEENPEYFL